MQALFDDLCQMSHILRDKVSQLAVFTIVPDLLIRIQIRSVCRQPFHINTPTETALQFTNATAMHHPSVDDENNSHREMLQQVSNERLKIPGTNIMVLDRKIQPQATAFWRETQCRDDRQAIPAIPTAKNRRMALGSPRAANRWLKHKPAFIQKNNGFTRSAGFFLYAANRPGAIRRWLLHRVHEPVFRVSDNSSPSVEGCAKHWTGRRLFRSVFRSLRRSVEASTIQFGNRFCQRLSTAAFAGDPSAFQTNRKLVPADYAPQKRPRLAVHRPDAIALWLRELRQPAERSRLRDVPGGAKQWLFVAYPLIVQGFLRVSYTCYRQKLVRLFNFSKINKRPNITLPEPPRRLFARFSISKGLHLPAQRRIPRPSSRCRFLRRAARTGGRRRR